MLIYLLIMILFLYFIYTNFDFEYFENNKISDKYIKKNTYLKPFIPLHSDYPNTILEKYNNSHHLKVISDINIGDAITKILPESAVFAIATSYIIYMTDFLKPLPHKNVMK